MSVSYQPFFCAREKRNYLLVCGFKRRKMDDNPETWHINVSVNRYFLPLNIRASASRAVNQMHLSITIKRSFLFAYSHTDERRKKKTKEQNELGQVFIVFLSRCTLTPFFLFFFFYNDVNESDNERRLKSTGA